MALPLQDSASGDLRKDANDAAAEDRSSISSSSSSSSSDAASMSHHERAESESEQQQQLASDDIAFSVDVATPPAAQLMDRQFSLSSSGDDIAVATPSLAQQMDRQFSLSSGDEEDNEGVAADPGRIPAEVFERDPSAFNKDWSMMSTESVFGLQVAPSSDFTGFVLAHPELMDIATPPRDSTAANSDADAAPPRASTAANQPDAAGEAEVLKPHFDNMPELPPGASANGRYSFAFPNLIEDKRHGSKKAQDEQPPTPGATMKAAPTPEPAPTKEEEPEAQTDSKPEEAAPEKEEAKGGFFSFLPCCS